MIRDQKRGCLKLLSMSVQVVLIEILSQDLMYSHDTDREIKLCEYVNGWWGYIVKFNSSYHGDSVLLQCLILHTAAFS